MSADDHRAQLEQVLASHQVLFFVRYHERNTVRVDCKCFFSTRSINRTLEHN